MKLRDGACLRGWFPRPPSWPRLLAIAVAAAALRITLGDLVIEPLAARIWPPIVAPAGVEEITGNVRTALLYLLIVWTFAAFGEEIAYRGFLLTRAADVGGRTGAAWWIGIVVVAVLFGYGHYYKGPAGIVDSGVAGLILGAAYMAAGRNLWASVLAHGLIDTYGVVALFLGAD
jgi:membrane protease YdiL (CAAX protease family)